MAENHLDELQDDLFYVVVFGPGYGESIVLRSPDKQWIVVDSCKGKKHIPAIKLLHDYDAEWTCAILTYLHQDHALKFDDVIDQPGGGKVGFANPADIEFEGSDSEDDVEYSVSLRLQAAYDAILAHWDREPASEWDMRRGDREEVGSVAITVLHPETATLGKFRHQANRVSSPVLVEWEGFRALLGADLPTAEWDALPDHFENLEEHALLKVPHHGSLGSISQRFAANGPARFWVMTPYSQKGKLPRFDDGRGVEELLKYVEKVHLTSLPEPKTDPRGPHSETTREELRDEVVTAHTLIADVGGLNVEPLEGESVDDKALRCFVAAGFDNEGLLQDVRFGPGSLTVRSEK